jgi:flotillin
MQQLRQLITAAATRVAQAQIGQINVVAGSDVEAYSALLASYPAAVGRVLEETSHAMGIDIRKLLNGEGRSS